MFDNLLKAGQYPIEFAFCILLALIPTIAWYLIFGKKHRHRFRYVVFTFIAGMVSGALILGYQYLWGEQFNFVFFKLEPSDFSENIQNYYGRTALGFLLIFLSVGFLEEYIKHWMVKMTDRRIFESIDDVIEFSIIGALGFAFLENIGYFFLLMVRDQHKDLVSLFFVRSVFVVFVHILCSAIYGYFYGLGYFAGPVLQDLERQDKKKMLPFLFHWLAHFKSTRLFRDEMATVGLLIAMSVHGLYDFFLEIETVGNLASSITGNESSFMWSDVQLHVIILPAMLISGYYFLSRLLDRVDYAKKYGHLELREEYVKGE